MLDNPDCSFIRSCLIHRHDPKGATLRGPRMVAKGHGASCAWPAGPRHGKDAGVGPRGRAGVDRLRRDRLDGGRPRHLDHGADRGNRDQAFGSEVAFKRFGRQF